MNIPVQRNVGIERSPAEVALADEIAAMLQLDPTPEREAFGAVFRHSGLPTKRRESWHYTDMRGTLKATAPLASALGAAAIEEARATLAALGRLGATRLVSVDGVFSAALSDAAPKGVTLAGPKAPSVRPAQEDPMSALAAALARESLHVSVAAGERAAGPIEFVHVSTQAPAASGLRLRLEIGAGAQASLVQRFAGAGAGTQRFARTEAIVEAAGEFDHLVLVEDGAAVHVETLRPILARHARYASFALVSGGALVRRQIFAELHGEDANIALSGLSLIEGARQADTTLEVVHAAPGGESREFYKHIVADEGVGVYQGKVIVNPGAQKTDGVMKSQAVLLSPSAQMNNKPELEIFADDVVCGHGATVAALDADQIFYLRARGIPRAEAEAMVLEAFGAEAVSRVADEALREPILASMRAWLAARGKGRP